MIAAKNFYDAYGALAACADHPMVLAGRNLFNESQLAAICQDVQAKLALGAHDRLLEIGCNVGTLLTPLAGLVREAVGQDHPDLLARYAEFGGVPANVTLVGGFWPDVQPPGLFDKILIYAVVIALPSPAVLDRVIDACLEKLAPGGRLLVGDLRNPDMLGRYLASEEGRRTSAAYAAQRDQDHLAHQALYAGRDRLFEAAGEPPDFADDAYLLGLLRRIRARGFDAWLLPQPSGLPSFLSREDLLVWRRR